MKNLHASLESVYTILRFPTLELPFSQYPEAL